MSSKKSVHWRKMIGERMMNSDGFTYVYGAVKDGSTVRPASQTTLRMIRHDKRAVKARELRDAMRDSLKD
jgi:hypothetical protein